ncbi:hypothetical protein BDW59DRAFT_161506 [Aspergillus cavernicola]|uniref:NAD(P)-binding protein n=1 Tax=Aspergillus cavernicola TaxID=176166 RepID=A0ABR4IDK5_9EURO
MPTASANQPSMKCFVYTSSSFAVTLPKPGTPFTVTANTFNDEAVQWISKPDADGAAIYAASKVAAERAISEWLQENNSSLVVNTILPNAYIGPIISPVNQGIQPRRDGEVPAQHFVNVQDDARLHVIALAHPDVQEERIFAVTAPFSINDIVAILRKLYPKRKWEDLQEDEQDLCVFDGVQRAEQLLAEAYGAGFIGLEESVKGNVADLAGDC